MVYFTPSQNYSTRRLPEVTEYLKLQKRENETSFLPGKRLQNPTQKHGLQSANSY